MDYNIPHQKDNPYKDKVEDREPNDKLVKSKKLSILDILDSANNVATLLTEEELDNIGSKVIKELEKDEESMEEWLEYADKAIELTNIKRDPKNVPFQNASNIKYPLITTAVTQWTSRALTEFIKNGKVANTRVIGKDPAGIKYRKSARVKEYLNWQILERMPSFLDQADKLHSQLAVVGTCFTKTWYDPIIQSCRSEVMPYDSIIINSGLKALEDALRISEYRSMSTNELIEHVRHDLFLELDFNALTKDEEDHEAVLHTLIEQHRYLDLDCDGYEEPYVVIVHKSSGKVLRIAPRFRLEDVEHVNDNPSAPIRKIWPLQFYSDFHFFPNPDGHCFFSLGFGTLLLDSNESVNTILNQLINAGHLATTQGGLIGKNLRIKKEDLYVEPGEWIVAESAAGTSIKDELVPFNYKEPSQTLFQLLGMLVEAANSLTSTSEALAGTADATNVSPNTLMALIQQGLKVYSATYKRICRGKRKELQILYRLLKDHLNEAEYNSVIDPDEKELKEMYVNGELADFADGSFDVVPMMDASMSTEAESMAREQIGFQANLQFAQVGAVNPRVAARNFHMALETPNIDQLIMPEPDPNAPNPQLIQMQAQMEVQKRQLALQELEVQIKKAEVDAKIMKMKADSLKAIADAEAAEAGTQLEVYKHAFERLVKGVELDLQAKEKDVELRDKNKESFPSYDDVKNEALNRGLIKDND